jgi:TolA-binding protein
VPDGSADAAAYTEDRINQLQQSATELARRIEQLQKQNQQLQQQLEKMRARYEQRLDQLEKGNVTKAPPVRPRQSKP